MSDKLSFLSTETRALLSEEELHLFCVAKLVLESEDVKTIMRSVRVHPGEYQAECPHSLIDAPGMPVSGDLSEASRAVHRLVEKAYGKQITHPVWRFDYSADLSGLSGPKNLSCTFDPIARALNKKFFGETERVQVTQ